MIPIYTFVDNDGVNTHIDTDGLRLWCKKTNQEIWNVPLNHELAASMIRDNVISIERIIELIPRWKEFDPIIMVKDGSFDSNGAPNVMLVDGHHRWFIACMAKGQNIPGHVLEVEQWKPFQLHGLPNITKEDLIKSPILKRNY